MCVVRLCRVVMWSVLLLGEDVGLYQNMEGYRHRAVLFLPGTNRKCFAITRATKNRTRVFDPAPLRITAKPLQLLCVEVHSHSTRPRVTPAGNMFG